ncbi:uncharacterized protein FIESC28_11215 [Fusarium coffeatum]|uniref:Uncharacterized protein n=1 Tax=Fusarium coffeatum TaxID=231269 RepID=A0A366QM68_9HYPO|nr:uncharacterized protein FIESC28_11215 [Fusarium coffeatum]RBR06024.1 hypothetical protein FIESC28_11215 [Fusarium coffeatum]
MSGLINKVKEAIHSDKDKHNDSHTTDSHTTGSHTTGTHTAGTHDSRTSGLPEGTAGPHGSRAANAADPRVDSDLDSSRRTGATGTTGGLGSTGHTAGGIGSTGGMTGTHSSGMTGTHSSGLPEGTAGPHGSRAANAADPRVDSDLDSSRRTGATGTTGGLGSTGHTAGGIGSTGHTAGGIGSTGHTAGGIGSTGGMTGTHSENMPGRTAGMTGTGMHGTHSENMPGHSTGLGSTGGMTGTHSSGMTGTHSSGLPEGTAGPHGSRAANAADPRVDSDLDSSRRTGGLGGSAYDQTTTGTSGLSSHGAGAHGPTGTHSSGLSGTNTGAHMGENTAYGTNNPGPAPKTAGPHKSDMLNKADPRVDSNLDGSKTVGKEKTFETSDFSGRDPTDATQVPPSVMQKHVPTEIAHDNPESDHSRRHSSVNQEHHRGL